MVEVLTYPWSSLTRLFGSVNAGKRVQRSSWGVQWKAQGKSTANNKIDGGKYECTI